MTEYAGMRIAELKEYAVKVGAVSEEEAASLTKPALKAILDNFVPTAEAEDEAPVEDETAVDPEPLVEDETLVDSESEVEEEAEPPVEVKAEPPVEVEFEPTAEVFDEDEAPPLVSLDPEPDVEEETQEEETPPVEEVQQFSDIPTTPGEADEIGNPPNLPNPPMWTSPSTRQINTRL